jgi:hypothetical protein
VNFLAVESAGTLGRAVCRKTELHGCLAFPFICVRTVLKPYLFDPLELALSEKQTPQVIEKVENAK